MRLYRSGLAGLILAIAAGCGSGDEQGRPAAETSSSGIESRKTLADIDACTLLTAGEIQSATGYSPGAGIDPVKSISGAAAMCAWPSEDGSVHQVAQVLVSWASAKDFEAYKQAMEKEGVTGIRQVDGPGRFTAVLEDMRMVQAFGERFMVQTMVEARDGTDPVAGATALAKAALERVE